MKPDYDLLFGNFFDDSRISDSRFYTFASNSLNNLTSANTNHQYDAIIASLTPLVAAFANEQGDVAFALNKQRGDTGSTDKLLDEFVTAMRAKEPEISYKVGGKGTPAYLMFYPHGITQYSQATKAAMPVLTDQLSKAATQYSAALGADLTTLLTGFATRWKAARDNQQQQMGSVTNNRGERTTARHDLELGMLSAIYTVAQSDVGNVKLGKSIFKFDLLFGQSHHEHKDYTGKIGIDETQMIVNRMLPHSAVVAASNTGDNAAFVIYCGATINAAPPANAVVINPGEHREFTPELLGNNAQSPYLLVKNTSMVNDCSFEVEIVE